MNPKGEGLFWSTIRSGSLIEKHAARARIVSIGEVLFDVFGEAAFLAGAPLNAMAHMHRLGHPVAFLSAVGQDDAGQRAIEGLEILGLSSALIARNASPTGRVDVLLEKGEPTYNIRRGVAYEHIEVDDETLRVLAAAQPAWIYCGTLAQCTPTTYRTTKRLFAALQGAKRLYDLNLRVGFDQPDIVLALLDDASVAKLNHHELKAVTSMCGFAITSEQAQCRQLAKHFNLEAVCLTRGARGAGLLFEDRFIEMAAPQINVVDTVGAGDAFAAALLHGLCEGWSAERIAEFGNNLGSFVASQRGSIPNLSIEQYQQLSEHHQESAAADA